MKRMLILSLLVISGCAPYASEWKSGREVHREERLPMLKDGRVHIGMSQYEFTRLWDRPPEINIDRWTDSLGISETWKFDWSCEVSSWHYARYIFHFDNRILTFWSEN